MMNWRRLETDLEQHAGPAAGSARTMTAEMKARKWMKMDPNLPDQAEDQMVYHMKNSQFYPEGWIEWNIQLAALSLKLMLF